MWHYRETRTITLEKDSLAKFFQRIQQKTDAVVAIYGKKNSGKSWAAISLCEDIDPHFNKNDIFDNLDDFFKQITDKETKRGHRAVLLDDFGSELDANNYKDDPSMATSHFVQKSRTMHNIYFITTPNKAFINKTMRERLCDYYMEMVGKDEQYNYGYVKCQEVQVNNKSGKVYYHRLKEGVDGKLRVGGYGKPITCFAVKQPSAILRDWYVPYREELADKQADKSAEKVLNRESKGQKNKNRTLDDWEKLATQVLDEGGYYFKESRGKKILNIVRLTAKLGLSRRNIQDLTGYMKDEGYIS
jgi:hypothetical protein